ncbi:nucleolar protein 6, partial [Phenoliferia sp. Uapishka_3]
MEVAPKKLTKKELKAKAYRANKGKGKKDESQADVPDTDNLDDDNTEGGDEDLDGEKKTKKRKRDVEKDGEEETKAEDAVVEGEGERKKKRQRGKKKSLQGQGPREDGKPRLVLFTGNLPFKVTVEAIQAHFASCGMSIGLIVPLSSPLTFPISPGETPTVRLLTPKPNPQSTVSKSKGCAFLEFQKSTSLQAALRLHESEMSGRKINVELTAGGGGNSDARKAKIEESRKRLLTEREKTLANRKKREGDTEEKDKSARWGKKGTQAPTAVEGEAMGDGGAKEAKAPEPKTQIKVINGKKVRDRRIPKTDNDGVEKERARKAAARAAAASSGANSQPLGQ